MQVPNRLMSQARSCHDPKFSIISIIFIIKGRNHRPHHYAGSWEGARCRDGRTALAASAWRHPYVARMHCHPDAPDAPSGLPSCLPRPPLAQLRDAVVASSRLYNHNDPTMLARHRRERDTSSIYHVGRRELSPQFCYVNSQGTLHVKFL